MPTRTQTHPRKNPLQSRSKATVDAILAATVRVLIKEGYDHASTNRIAQTAGVSVGSLYQYFPSKEALVMAVMDRHCARMIEVLEARLVSLMEESLEVVARALVEEMIAMHRVDPKLHQVLIQQVPKLGRSSAIQEMDKRFAGMVALYLEAHRSEIEIDDVELAAYLLVTSVEALTHAAVIDRPELLDGAAFTQNIIRMVLSYVAPSRAAELARRRVAKRPVGLAAEAAL